MLRGRAVLSGSSTHSDPTGFKIYSGITAEVGAARRIGGPFAIELTLRSESREVDRAGDPGAPDVRLGSLELFPIGLAFHYVPWGGTFQPYLGAGLNLTLCWEKTGALDDTQVSPSIGPMIQAGLDVELTQVLVLNLDLRWNLLRPEVHRAGAKVVTLQIDPLTIGAGVGVRF
jgi:outer membrane protein